MSLPNALQDSKRVNAPDDKKKPKTPLRKDELEKIAAELKKKLARASVAAKQLRAGRLTPESPVLQTLFPKTSPLKNYYMWKRQIALSGALGLLPNLQSPGALASLPIRGADDDTELPTKRRRPEPQMVLREISRPRTPVDSAADTSAGAGSTSRASDSVTSSAEPKTATTPTLARKQLDLLKTPTQPLRDDSTRYVDTEGADLLMHLATSPLPAKPFATPRASTAPQMTKTTHFVAPMTPKRTGVSLARTPQNRFTPALLGVPPGSALPLMGLALTPAGFNMSDYVNFFTPSPSGSAARNLMKAPEFHGPAKLVDGKMINFDKVGLFGPKE